MLSELRHPGRWLWLILLVPIVVGLARLRFDVEVFDLLPSDLPVVQGLKLYQQYFANARELIITLRAAAPEQAEDAARRLAERLRAHTNLVASVIWQAPWLEHPGEVGELLAYLWFNQPPALFQQLTNRLAPEKLPDAISTAREQLATTLSPEEIARLSYDPFGLTRLPEEIAGAAPAMGQGQEGFSSNDGRFRLIYVKAATDLPTYRECEQWLKAIKQISADSMPVAAEVTRRTSWQARATVRLVTSAATTGVSIGYTGRPAFVAEVAGGMQHDVKLSVGGTALIIAVLFWLAHRRVKPMLWLLTLLAIILGSTLALGGLIFGKINVVSMGFAAILLGLAVDYAVVHYQEALAQPDLSIPQIRSAIAPSIFWAAVTTISAFLVLNFGGLPGLGQLGTLVGLGVALSACIMIFEFLPPLFPERRATVGAPASLPAGTEKKELAGRDAGAPGTSAGLAGKDAGAPRFVFAATAAALLVAVIVLAGGLPLVDATANALRPRNSPAYSAMDEIKKELNQNREPLWVIVGGRTETEVAGHLEAVESALKRATSNNIIGGFTLPTALWPQPEFQAANRAGARQLVSEGRAFKEAAATNGFTENALGLTKQMVETWRQAGQAPGVFWPSNQLAQWILEKVTVRSGTNLLALGLVNRADDTGQRLQRQLSSGELKLPREGVWLSGWELLGGAIFSRVKARMWFVLTPMVCLVLLSLLLAFRGAQEVLLSLAVLLLSALTLFTVMRLAGWSWNLLNLMALPLILGTGVDYSIFMQLALRRHGGDLRMAYRSVGRALLLCGATACAGFGSLAFSTNAGMGSLGQVCAVGIASNMLISIFLLPTWWHTTTGQGGTAGIQASERLTSSSLTGPSSLYRAEIWRLGLFLVRVLPLKVCVWVGHFVADAYWIMARHRREIAVQNILPAVADEPALARKTARDLFHQFTGKIIDLWRYEAGLPIDDLFGEYSGWEHFVEAQKQQRGVLLVTPHLGNWEFGAPWLARRGVTLQVITMAEPTQDFTKLRQASRARWNIETFVIGEDPFAFLEVIRRLEGGATVALLVDRPPGATAVTVELFGRPFLASIAVAELARASGCMLVPVYLPRTGQAYAAHLLPAIPYDRAALRDRAARQQLTQEIIRVFEPVIRQHLNQWYHFVPIWRG